MILDFPRFVAASLGVVLLATTGCGVIYDTRAAMLLKNASVEDYGPPPPADHQEQEQHAVLSLLKDPGSAQFAAWSAAASRDIIPDDVISVRPIPVWITSVEVNAKNSYGGYTGFKSWHFAWMSGSLVAVGVPETTEYGNVYTSWEYLIPHAQASRLALERAWSANLDVHAGQAARAQAGLSSSAVSAPASPGAVDARPQPATGRCLPGWPCGPERGQ